jgi:hypothetical protein
MNMREQQGQNPEKLTPFQVVLLSFVFFNKSETQEVRILEDGLVRCMIQAGCPRRETALGVLNKMVEFGHLERIKDEQGVSYKRTAEGIKETPTAKKPNPENN